MRFPSLNYRKDPLFGLLLLVYFTANLGRLSYTACMLSVINRGMLSAASAGLVGTGFFICYGAGQIGSGFIGGRYSPGRLIFIGLFCTALANLAMGFAPSGTFMLVTWSVNGLIQSILWPPVLRIIVENYTAQERRGVCADISATFPVAVMFSYFICAGIVSVLSYRAVFFIYSVFLFAVSGIWFFAYGKIRPQQATQWRMPAADASGENPQEKKPLVLFGGKNTPGAAIVLFCLSLVCLGVLRDGLMAWIPAYITNVFSYPESTAILFTGVIPPIYLCGIYLCSFLFSRIRDEGKTSVCFFGVTLLAALLLRFAGNYHIFISLFCFSVIIASMVGVNMVLVTFVPARFLKYGLVSFMTGLNNSMVYVGSSASYFGMALILENSGWPLLLTIILFLAMAGFVFNILAVPRWAAFSRQHGV